MIAGLRIIDSQSGGFSDAAIAKAVGVSPKSVFNWDSGKALPRRAHMNTVQPYLVGLGAINQNVTTGMLFDLISSAKDSAERKKAKKDRSW